MSLKNNLNIVVAGKSGVGKSSLLNYIVDKQIFETGVGEPVTQDYFNLHSFVSDKNITYNLFDTKGIEPDTTEEFIREVREQINIRAESEDIFDHIHTLYYCIAATGKRLEPFEIKFIKDIERRLDVVIVLTKSDLVSDSDYTEMCEILRKELDASEDDLTANIKIVKVCSVHKVTRKGTSEPFGREEILKHSIIGLWNTVAKTIPNLIYSIVYSVSHEIIIKRHTEEREIFLKTNHMAENKNYNDDNVEILFADILSFESLEESGFDDLSEGEQFILMKIIEGGKGVLHNFDSYNDSFLELQGYIDELIKEVLSFYKIIYGNDFENRVPLIKSKRSLDELKEFLLHKVKDYLLGYFDLLEGSIAELHVKEGFWESIFSTKKDDTRTAYEDFRIAADRVYSDIQKFIQSFSDIFNSELHQYGVLKLKYAEQNEGKLVDNAANEQYYIDELNCFVSDDGKIDEKERQSLERLRIRFNISEERAQELEASVVTVNSNNIKEDNHELLGSTNQQLDGVSENESQYLEEIKFMFEDDNQIDEKKRVMLERFRTRFNISEERASELEQKVINENSIQLTNEEKEYFDEYKTYLSEGAIGEKERRLLDRLAIMLGLSKERTKEIESYIN